MYPLIVKVVELPGIHCLCVSDRSQKIPGVCIIMRLICIHLFMNGIIISTSPSTHVPRNSPSVTAHTTPQHPSPLATAMSSYPHYKEEEHPLISQLATVATHPHNLAQENTGTILMVAVECDCQLLTSNIIISLYLYSLQFHLTSNQLLLLLL